MTILPHLTIHDTAELLEGEPAMAWSWTAPEAGCPLLSPTSPPPTDTGPAADRKDCPHALQD